MGPQTKRLRNLLSKSVSGISYNCFNGAANKTLAEFVLDVLHRIWSRCFNGAANKTLAEFERRTNHTGRRRRLQWGRKQNACGIGLLDGFLFGLFWASMGPQTKRLRNTRCTHKYAHHYASFNGAANKTLAELI